MSKVLLKCLFDEVLTVENADFHVFVCLKYNECWVVYELAEGICEVREEVLFEF